MIKLFDFDIFQLSKEISLRTNGKPKKCHTELSQHHVTLPRRKHYEILPFPGTIITVSQENVKKYN